MQWFHLPWWRFEITFHRCFLPALFDATLKHQIKKEQNNMCFFSQIPDVLEVSHRLQLITDTKLADEVTFLLLGWTVVLVLQEYFLKHKLIIVQWISRCSSFLFLAFLLLQCFHGVLWPLILFLWLNRAMGVPSWCWISYDHIDNNFLSSGNDHHVVVIIITIIKVVVISSIIMTLTILVIPMWTEMIKTKHHFAHVCVFMIARLYIIVQNWVSSMGFAWNFQCTKLNSFLLYTLPFDISNTYWYFMWTPGQHSFSSRSITFSDPTNKNIRNGQWQQTWTMFQALASWCLKYGRIPYTLCKFQLHWTKVD